MKTRGVIGRKIVGVRQFRMRMRVDDPTRQMNVLSLILDDGKELVPLTRETDFGDYAHDLIVRKAPKKRS